MSGTVICPRCSRTVPWTAQEWNGAEQCCTQCAATAVEPGLRHRGGVEVKVTGLDVPFGDVLVLVFKVSMASLAIGPVFGVAYLVLKTIWSTR